MAAVEAVACTSKPQYWSIPQSMDRVIKIPIPEMNDIATGTDKGTDEEKRHPKTRLLSTLFDARTVGERYTPYNSINVIPSDQQLIPVVATPYGDVPVGSVDAI